MMSSKPVLAVFFLATVGIAAGSAWALAGNDSSNGMANVDAAHAAVMNDFGKLSAAGAKGFQDVNLARLAIYDGKTDQAKQYVDGAATSFEKAKNDDSAFVKAETDLMTADQVAKKKGDAKAPEAAAPAGNATNNPTAKIAWLPVDGALTLNEDYTLSPAKTKAVSEANESLAKGDRKGALDHLKLADVSTSVVLEVVPRDRTISDVHQAAQMIDSGKFYEGSQALRKVQMDARYDVTDVVGTLKVPVAAAMH